MRTEVTLERKELVFNKNFGILFFPRGSASLKILNTEYKSQKLDYTIDLPQLSKGQKIELEDHGAGFVEKASLEVKLNHNGRYEEIQVVVIELQPKSSVEENPSVEITVNDIEAVQNKIHSMAQTISKMQRELFEIRFEPKTKKSWWRFKK